MSFVDIECSMRKGANVKFRIITKLKKLWKKPIRNYKNIPIVINNYNRLDCLKQLIDWLESNGYKNIHIIDNQSTYLPLLAYYKTLPFTIYRLDKNKGHFSLWETIIFTRFSDDYYVYTDPDVVPIEACKEDVLQYFKNLLEENPSYKKVGFALKIDDIPDVYKLKNEVLNWEKKFWEKPIKKNVYDALIDTTFALYRPGAKGGADGPAIRTAGVYTARHLPWYEDSSNLSEESKYYLKSATQASSWITAERGENQQYFE